MREGFVLIDSMELREIGGNVLEISGDIECDGGIVVEVRELLQILYDDGRDQVVQSDEYSYNAKLSGVGNILRYDSPHGDDGIAHHAQHHKHCVDDVRAGVERVEVVGDEEWPSLMEVLEELRGWLSDHTDLAQPTHTRRG
jgi:hypothetical protein